MYIIDTHSHLWLRQDTVVNGAADTSAPLTDVQTLWVRRGRCCRRL